MTMTTAFSMQAMYAALVIFASLWHCILADGNDETQYIRRVARPGVECIPLLRVTQYERGTFHPGPDKEWNCQLLSSTPAAMGKAGKIVKLDNLYNLPEGTIQQFKSGESVLTLPQGTVNAAGIQIPMGAAASIAAPNDLENEFPTVISHGDNFLASGDRKLQSYVDKKVLVIRVKTLAGRTTANPDAISDAVFGTYGDSMNLSTQYDACSFGKLTFSPLKSLNKGDPSLDAPGVYEVEVATSVTDHEVLREMITDKLNADWPNTPLPDVSWGELDEDVRFDHVLYCMPPETSMGIAYAFVNSWLSVYKDNWCLYPSTQMHEIGHSIGLDHAWEGNSEYADQSGMMGFSYSSNDSPKMCFNSAKSWQLGFYADKSTTVNPLVTPSWSGKLVGIANYDMAGDDVVLVKIETGSDLDYYMNFNRQTGMNSETQEGGDQVLITTQGREGVAFAKSTLVAKLSQGQVYEIPDFGGVSDNTVRIVVETIDTSASPGYASVSITGNGQETSSVFLNCGGDNYSDGSIVWITDVGYYNSGASSYIMGEAIAGVPIEKQGLYQSERYDKDLAYQIPLERGSYDIFLHFSEIYFANVGARVFDVRLEGEVKFLGVDVYREAGNAANKALVKSVKGFFVSDGALNINFTKIQQNPKISAIEIHPSTSSPPTSRPTLKPTPAPSPFPTPFPSPLPSPLPTPNPVSDPTPSPLLVTDLVLVNAKTNADVDGGFSCAPYICMEDAVSFNVRAETSHDVKSVQFALVGPVSQQPRVENVPPFSLFGDTGGDYKGSSLPPGLYSMTAQPFSLLDATGESGRIFSLKFVVAEPRVPTDEPSLEPSIEPSLTPSSEPSLLPSIEPSSEPSWAPSHEPSGMPSNELSGSPTTKPSDAPSMLPSDMPSDFPTTRSTPEPTEQPTSQKTGGTWNNVTYDDFESGWGSFTRTEVLSGRPDSARITRSGQQAYIHQGRAALRIRDNSGAASSVFHAQNHDVTAYSDLRVSFWYFPRLMDGTDDFLLEYSSDGGATWNIVKAFQNDRDFVNGKFHSESIVLSKSSLSAVDLKLTSKARIRFRCDASGDMDLIYIDEVLFQGYKE